jgi:S-adenosylmethionine:tRNA ribosyltransferase-isomerase
VKPAVLPRRGPRGAKLLVVDACGRIAHHTAVDLPRLIRPGDLIVANDAATLPASLVATHVRSGETVEIRLAGRRSLAPDAVTIFTAVMFGGGDYRTPTERRTSPPALSIGDELIVGPLRATIATVHKHSRLIDIRFHHSAEEIWAGLAKHGRPIQYSHVQAPLAMWDTWTSIATQPVAFEAPSAGFILDWSTLRALRGRGGRVATLTHAAGISSTGDLVLDRLLPFDEPYVIPSTTAKLVSQTKQCGGRVIAVGTTVVRALEHAARRTGFVRPGGGVATGRIGPETRLRIVDGIVSGMHEPGTSHFELLRAFQEDDALATMAAEAEAGDYHGHEFGDVVFIERSGDVNAKHRHNVWSSQQLSACCARHQSDDECLRTLRPPSLQESPR